jgi:predicted MFS family arabinose efflux permease
VRPRGGSMASSAMTSTATTVPLPAAAHAARRGAAAGSGTVVALVCVGMFMTTLDALIVNIGLPSIARAFGTPLTGAVEWVIIGYPVAIGGLLLTFGRLSDVVGRRPIWTAGLAVFTLGSAVCGAAPSLGLLVAARALQARGWCSAHSCHRHGDPHRGRSADETRPRTRLDRRRQRARAGSRAVRGPRDAALV